MKIRNKVLMGVAAVVTSALATGGVANAAYNHTAFYAAKPANVTQKHWIESGLYACDDLKSRNSWYSRYINGFPGAEDIFWSVHRDLAKKGYYSAVSFPSLVNRTYCPGLTLK